MNLLWDDALWTLLFPKTNNQAVFVLEANLATYMQDFYVSAYDTK